MESNQTPPLEDFDAWGSDPWLPAAVAWAGAGSIAARAAALGLFVGSAEAQALAADANRHAPELRTLDAAGERLDRVDYHPAYHALMAKALGAGVHSAAWKPGGRFAARAALFYLWNQLEQGTACPVTMTFASVPVFRHAPALASEWLPRVLEDAYDPSSAPAAAKRAVTVGMAMTEKQGGSDLRTVQARATPDGDTWRLEGSKWFCSAPMSDAFFTLARTPEGVTCFLAPRRAPDGSRNGIEIQRLKDKLGNRSNASSEIEYRGTAAHLVGEPGRGIATILEMAHHTRFDIVVGIAGMMRAGLDQALHHARHREAFGRRLADHALMANVLADLALEAEAALLVAFRLAAAFDASAADARERAIQRVLTPVAKYWSCKRMTPFAAEAMECLGGNGYVEESPLARLFREAPLNGIWEGSANVICLDALRAFERAPEGLQALGEEIAGAGDAAADAALRSALALLADRERAPARARAIVEGLALAAQAALMRRHASPQAADAFSASRLGTGSVAHAFGTLGGEEGTHHALAARAMRA